MKGDDSFRTARDGSFEALLRRLRVRRGSLGRTSVLLPTNRDATHAYESGSGKLFEPAGKWRIVGPDSDDSIHKIQLCPFAAHSEVFDTVFRPSKTTDGDAAASWLLSLSSVPANGSYVLFWVLEGLFCRRRTFGSINHNMFSGK